MKQTRTISAIGTILLLLACNGCQLTHKGRTTHIHFAANQVIQVAPDGINLAAENSPFLKARREGPPTGIARDVEPAFHEPARHTPVRLDGTSITTNRNGDRHSDHVPDSDARPSSEVELTHEPSRPEVPVDPDSQPQRDDFIAPTHDWRIEQTAREHGSGLHIEHNEQLRQSKIWISMHALIVLSALVVVLALVLGRKALREALNTLIQGWLSARQNLRQQQRDSQCGESGFNARG